MISVHGLNFQYPNRTTALENVSLTFPTGLSMVIGGNGAGKTTLFRLLCGQLDLPSPRMIEWPPVGVNSRVYVPEHATLPDYFTVEEIFLCAGIQLTPYHEPTWTLVSSFRKKLYRECSLGMRKRLILGLALLKNARLTCLDEPFNGIDIDTLLVIQSALTKLLHNDEQRYFLVASHQWDVMERVAKTTIILHEGRVRFAGPLPQLFQSTATTRLLDAYHKVIHSP
jgi:ABC-2 type transport system ATP-binding protein